MSGTKSGGLRAAATNKELYGSDFFARAGAKGGKKTGLKKGWASEKVGKDGLTGIERARVKGKIGGQTSRRTKKTT